ncbi:MAG TPA: hypothetical protein VKR06_15555 [Ktedonosporobacter sp.]|nr:hypothetical protein [Ktedonosporobacter sp.]
MAQTTTIDQLTRLFEQTTPTNLDAPDASYADALRRRWQESAREAGLLPLAGLVNVCEMPRTYTIHPLEYWRVERVNMREAHRFAVPPAAHEKLEQAYAAGVPVKWLLWAEQHVTPPKIEYRQKTVYVTKVYSDPALIALIQAGNDVGIPYLVHGWLHT